MLYDPTASVPAVLLAKNYVDSSTTYMYNVREPGGELVASFDASETPNKSYHHQDDLGSTVLITNGSRSARDAFTYGAWGEVLESIGTTKPYTYVGSLGYYTHSSDQGSALSDLLQLGVRFYDPELGRFTQRDPAGDGLNWYWYARGRPQSAVDPNGLTCWSEAIELGYNYGARVRGWWDDGPDLGPSNAVQHCMWTCIAYTRCGGWISYVPDVHEWIVLGYPPVPMLSNPDAANMDLHNNAEGRDCGSKAYWTWTHCWGPIKWGRSYTDDEGDCATCCIEKAIKGELKWIDPEWKNKRPSYPPAPAPSIGPSTR